MSIRATQDTQRLPNRAGMSSNWRARDDNASSNNAAVMPRMNRPHGAPSEFEKNKDHQAAPKEIRPPTETTTADERAKQAIQEGRRLYVGNLPYIAKTDDVAMLFPENEYTV